MLSTVGTRTRNELRYYKLERVSPAQSIVDFRISGTRQTGAVTNRTYRGAQVFLYFFEFTINED